MLPGQSLATSCETLPPAFCQNVVLIDLINASSFLGPSRPAHRNLSRAWALGVVKVHTYDTFKRLELILFQIFLGNCNVGLLNASLRSILHVLSPMFGWLAWGAALQSNSAAVLPVMAQCQFVCTVLRNVWRDLGIPVVVDAALFVKCP